MTLNEHIAACQALVAEDAANGELMVCVDAKLGVMEVSVLVLGHDKPMPINYGWFDETTDNPTAVLIR